MLRERMARLCRSTLGVATMFVFLIFGIGPVTATAPMITQELGRRWNAVRDPRRTRCSA